MVDIGELVHKIPSPFQGMWAESTLLITLLPVMQLLLEMPLLGHRACGNKLSPSDTNRLRQRLQHQRPEVHPPITTTLHMHHRRYYPPNHTRELIDKIKDVRGRMARFLVDMIEGGWRKWHTMPTPHPTRKTTMRRKWYMSTIETRSPVPLTVPHSLLGPPLHDESSCWPRQCFMRPTTTPNRARTSMYSTNVSSLEGGTHVVYVVFAHSYFVYPNVIQHIKSSIIHTFYPCFTLKFHVLLRLWSRGVCQLI